MEKMERAFFDVTTYNRAAGNRSIRVEGYVVGMFGVHRVIEECTDGRPKYGKRWTVTQLGSGGRVPDSWPLLQAAAAMARELGARHFPATKMAFGKIPGPKSKWYREVKRIYTEALQALAPEHQPRTQPRGNYE